MSNGAVVAPQILCSYCTNVEVKSCIKCTKLFCPDHSSKITPDCCKDCFAEFASVIIEHTKTDVEYDVKTDSVVTHRSSGHRINLIGPDYVWYSVWIQQLTDEELANSFQFHKFVVSLLESTKDERQIRKNQAHIGERSTRITSSTTTVTNKTKRVKQTKSLRDVLIASGITDETTIKAMLLAAGVTS
jgi:hypothetical protein